MARQKPLLKMEEAVHQSIKTRDLLRPGDRLVVAVSGGPDSVALLACLVALSTRWNWVLNIGHVNHGLRGVESDGDAAFVEQLGKRFDVPVSIKKVSVKKEDAKRTRQSFQAYAHTMRYHALEWMLRECHGTKIATGHTVDDQAETVLMWMLRGSGTGGMSGIPPKRGAEIVRPFLDIPRSDILAYLKERQLSYRIDSSNGQQVYMRNRVRNDLMPQLKGYAPGLANVLSRQADIIREDHMYLERVATEAFQHVCVAMDEREIQLNRTTLLALPVAIQRRIVRHALQRMTGNTQNPRFDRIQQILNCLSRGQSGWTIAINLVQIGQEYHRLVFSKQESSEAQAVGQYSLKEFEVGIPGDVVWPLTGQRLAVVVKSSLDMVRNPSTLEMLLDADTFTHDLRIRSWRPGDVFCPKGMGGRKKKLQDFFSDMKLPRSQRKNIPLLVAPEGILWIGGLREDERFQISPSTTSFVIATMTS